jgi:hypothetical protein
MVHLYCIASSPHKLLEVPLPQQNLYQLLLRAFRNGQRLGIIYRTISSSNCHQSRSTLTYQSIPKHWTSVLAERPQSLQPITTLLHIPIYVKPSPSCDNPIHKKRKHRLQQRSTRQHRPHSKPHRRSPKSHSPLDQGSTVAAVSSTEGRLPSPTPSAPHATDTDMSLGDTSDEDPRPAKETKATLSACRDSNHLPRAHPRAPHRTAWPHCGVVDRHT